MRCSSWVTWNTSGRESTSPDPVLAVTMTDTCTLITLPSGKEHLCEVSWQGGSREVDRDRHCNTIPLKCILSLSRGARQPCAVIVEWKIGVR